MSRYIDADNAIERLGAYLMADAQIEYGGLASEDIDDWKPIAIDILKGAPSIDIVRCKECKHWNCEMSGCKRNPSVLAWRDDDFCSYGEPNLSEKPNSSTISKMEQVDWKDQMWAEAVEDEPQTDCSWK